MVLFRENASTVNFTAIKLHESTLTFHYCYPPLVDLWLYNKNNFKSSCNSIHRKMQDRAHKEYTSNAIPIFWYVHDILRLCKWNVAKYCREFSSICTYLCLKSSLAIWYSKSIVRGGRGGNNIIICFNSFNSNRLCHNSIVMSVTCYWYYITNLKIPIWTDALLECFNSYQTSLPSWVHWVGSWVQH